MVDEPDNLRQHLEGARRLTAGGIISKQVQDALGFGSALDHVKRIFAAQQATQFAELRRSFTATSGIQQVLKQAAESARQFSREARAIWDEAMPDNWQALSYDDQYDAVDLAVETGWCLVWVPRVEVMQELLGVEPQRREATLLRHRAVVLDDLASCLRQAETADSVLVTQTAAGIDSYRDGHWRPAQALSAACLTTAIEQQLGFKYMSRAEQKLPRDVDNVGLRLLRMAIIASSIDFASYFDPHQGPEGFSRNRTLHHANDEMQYTEVNSLASLMLLVGLLREAELWRDREIVDDD